MLVYYKYYYKIVTNILGVFWYKSKNKTGIIILMYNIKININFFKASLLTNKIYKVITIIIITFIKNLLILKKI